MWAVRRLQWHFLKPLPFLHERGYFHKELPLQLKAKNEVVLYYASQTSPCSIFPFSWVNGFCSMSTTRGRSKVMKRIKTETWKTVMEMRYAKKIRKKLMTEEERLLFNLRRAKKKVALLLKKLRKYKLPALPSPHHDPELLTPEQLHAYKKIGFKNRNYAVVGIRGVFGGIVQNMHMHWKFHETVQVCCDNFPKEKIEEMASMIARLSGGIVVNIHQTKTIIMFRGRNYRQPKYLIPLNTLTRRKALFKAKFEQALDCQKLNIEKIKRELRRKGVNPADPFAMDSVQKVASAFFRAIDEKQGTPYVFRWDRQPIAADGSLEAAIDDNLPTNLPAEDSEQEELDRFVAGIEDAADREWEAEEAREKEEASNIRYWENEDVGMMRGRDPNWNANSEEHHYKGHENGQGTMNIRKGESGDDIYEASEGGEWDENSCDEDEEDARVNLSRTEARKHETAEMRNRSRLSEESVRNRPRKDEIAEMRNRDVLSEWSTRTRPRNDETTEMRNRVRLSDWNARTRPREDEIAEMRIEETGGSESNIFGDSEGDNLWESEDEKDTHGKASTLDAHDFHSGSEFNDEEFGTDGRSRGRTEEKSKNEKNIDESWDSD